MSPSPGQSPVAASAPEGTTPPATPATVDAIYVDGAFQPLEAVDLPAGARVRLQVTLAAPVVEPAQATTSTASLRQFTLVLSSGVCAGLAQYVWLERGAFSWLALGLALLATLTVGAAFRGQRLWFLRGQAPGVTKRPGRAAVHRPAERLKAPARVAKATYLASWSRRRPALQTLARGLSRRARGNAQDITPHPQALNNAWQRGLLLGAPLLMLLVLINLARHRSVDPPPNLTWSLLPWTLAIACYLLALAAPRSPAGRWRITPGALLVPLALGSCALLLRVWQLDSIPPTLSGDEGSQGLEALKVLAGQIRNPFTTGWLGVPTLSFYFNAPTIAVLGPTATALRLPWALVGTATVLAAYALIARLHGQALALITAALLAGYHYHIHFSRLGSNQIADGLFATLTLLCLYRGCDRRSPFDWALCGTVIGVAQFFYAGARFVAVLAVVVVLFLALRDGRRFWREQGWGVAAMLGVALLSAAPMIQFALRFPAEYNARLNEVGIFQSGWLEREQPIRGQGALPILLDQFWRAALAYNAYPDRTVWYGAPRPLFDLAHGTLFILGLGFAATRLLDRRLFPLVAWWGGAVIMGGMLTESPPSSQRLITTAIPAICFVALGLLLLAQGLGQALGPARKHLLTPMLALATAALIALSLRSYFVSYTPLRVYGNANAVLATELAHYANQQLNPGTRLIFFGWPRMSVDFGTIPYLAPQFERVDLLEPLSGPPPRSLAPPDRDAVFVFVPERASELELVRASFPGGTLETVPSPRDGAMLFSAYRVPRSLLGTAP